MKYQVIGHHQFFLRNTTNISSFLYMNMRDQDWKESTIGDEGGEDEVEDASLGEEDDGIFREEVEHEPQPTPMQLL
jgi:hypothetical protein